MRTQNKHITARPSFYGRRVKLILIYIFFALALVTIQASRVFAEDYVRPPGRVNLIRTSHIPDCYSVIECSGDTISARGCYAKDRLRKMYIANKEDASGSYSMHASADGSYTADLTLKAEDGHHSLVLKMTSGAMMIYRMYYDAQIGWYFPLNGLETKNRDVFDHIYEAPLEAAALYLSASDDPGEINTALEQIKGYAESVTAGLEDDYDKARAISQFIAKSFYYDTDARDTDAGLDTIALYNVLKAGKTVCGGFANMFCAMAEAVGIDAVNIKGGTVNRQVPYENLAEGVQNHEWAAFWYEKEQRWVWEDACWDGVGTYENGEYKPGELREMYFDITDDAFSLNHRADKAERRHYFAAKPETSIIGGEAVTDTAQTEEKPAETTADMLSQAEQAAAETTSAAVTLPVKTQPDNSQQDDTILIVIITVLAALVVAAAVILIATIRKGRKN